MSTEWVDANQRYLVAALDVLRAHLAGADPGEARARLDAARAAMPAPAALEAVAAAFDLSRFERDTLLMAAGVDLETAFARSCGKAQDDPVRVYATFSLALATLPGAHWSAITPAAPLRHWHLVELAHPDAPTTSPVRVDERVLHALAGISYLDLRIEALAEPLPAPPRLPAALREAADRIAAGWSDADPRVVVLHGRQRADLCGVTGAACAALGLRPVRLRAADLPAAPADRDLLARLCERETALDGRAWVVDVDDAAPDAGRLALDLADRVRAPVVVIAREPPAGAPSGWTRVAVRPTSAGEARTAWREALGACVESLDGWLDRVAGQFDLDLAAVDAVAAEVRLLPDPGPLLWDACRRRTRPALDGLSQCIEPRASWDDLVLPAPQAQVLRTIEAHVRHRLTVLDDWGFAGRGLGVTAPFSGPSGTGKTLAAEVLARALRLDLYRVDLSQVVSKYIGETEKNLRRVFDAAEAGGAVLLFDEADALFGKRSEVRDSHDRYANIEVSYLLQRMETYRGLAILTTNLKSALDPAFLRRLRFVVQFSFPDADARAEIWRRIFPARTPTEGLDPVKLARLTVAGGTIHNIALSAAFLAVEDGEPVRMGHLLRAARGEYVKLEKPLTDAEVAGWTR